MEERLLEQAQTALKQGDLDGAIELLLKVLEHNPAETEARRYLRATALRRLERSGGKPGAVSSLLNTALGK